MDNNPRRRNNKNIDNRNDLEYQRDLEKSMKDENDALVGQVYSSVKSIKQHALEMKEKIQLSNQQCNDMDKKYSQSNSLIEKTMKQLNDVLSANSNYWCYLAIFIILIIFILYRLGK